MKKIFVVSMKIYNFLPCVVALGFWECSHVDPQKKMDVADSDSESTGEGLEKQLRKSVDILKNHLLSGKSFYYVRHGQTTYNSQHLEVGWLDVPLSELGKEQAQKAGKYMYKNGINVNYIYSSTLQRAINTAEIIKKYGMYESLEIEKIDAIKERNVGILEGLSYAPGSEHEKKIDDSWEGKYSPEGAESWNFVALRSLAFINQCLYKHGTNEKFLIVAHAGVYRAIHEILFDELVDIPNCKIVYFDKSFINQKNLPI